MPAFERIRLGLKGLSDRGAVRNRGLRKTLISVQVAFDLFLGIAVLYGFAFVVDFFTLAESDLHLGVSLFGEEDAERDDSISFFFYFIFELAELAFGKQELAVVYGSMVIGGAKAIFCDMHIAHP